MRRVRVLIIATLLVLFGPYLLYSQTQQVRPVNVQFHFDEKTGSVVVTYDLASASQLETYEVRLVFKDGRNMVIQPNSVMGDVGQDIEEGGQKRIVWDIFNDIDELPITAQPQIIIISINKVQIDPSIALIMEQISQVGQRGYTFKLQRDGLMIFGLGAGISSLVFKLKADDYIDQQNRAVSLDDYNIAGENADSYYRASYITGGLATVAIGISLYQYIRLIRDNKRSHAFNLSPYSGDGLILSWTTSF